MLKPEVTHKRRNRQPEQRPFSCLAFHGAPLSGSRRKKTFQVPDGLLPNVDGNRTGFNVLDD
jgi:hypothetical protein